MLGTAETDDGAKESGVGIGEGGGQATGGEEFLRPVNIAEEEAEKFGPLDDAFFDEAPLVGRDEQRDEVDFPRTADALGIAIDVVGDAVLADAALARARRFS